jgi:ATP-dependent RNA helicase RhlE
MAYYAYRSTKPSNYRGRNSGGGGGSRGGRKTGRGQYIDPSRFIKAASVTEETVSTFVPKNMFSDFPVEKVLHDNLIAKGFTEPTPIQDETIPLALAGRDVIGIADTGTGKTAAFGIPLLHRLITESESHALIIAPTRELAQQIDDELRTIGKGSGMSGAILIGGASMGPQLRDLRFGPRIVIGTPGRIKDHIERGSLNLSKFNMVVLDEVDRMLDMGFVDDVREILSRLEEPRQSLFFSATLDTRVRGLINSFSNDPEMVSVKTGETAERVHQDVIHYMGNMEKLDKLHDLLTRPDVTKVIVFDETQRAVERLGNELIDRGFKADSIHGGKSQGQRQRALDRFKKNDIKVLVATDVAARGIDVKDISHVVNYTVPQTYDTYVHRIGRAGRAGKTGYALTFVTN